MMLLRGRLVPSLAAAGVVTLSAALGWRDRRWRISVAVLAAASVTLMWLVNLVIGGSWIFNPAPPLSVCVYAAVPVFILATIPLGWRSASARRRLLVVPALLLCTVAAAGYINRYYGYYPTVSSVFGAGPAHEVSIRQLRGSGLLGKQRVKLVDATFGPRPATTVQNTTTPPITGPLDVGRVVETNIPGTASGFQARPAWVYLPPAWFLPNRPQLPAVILLEGTPGSPQDWIRVIQIQRIADEYASTHHGMAPILVAVDQNGSFAGDTECVDRPHSRADTYVSVDVRNFVARNFGVPLRADQWALQGYSEGGTCALTVALRHPDLFRTFVDVSGDVTPSMGSPAASLSSLYGGSTTVRNSYDPALLLRGGAGRGMSAWFQAGSSDHKGSAAARSMYLQAQQAGASAQYRTVDGGHTFHSFRVGFADSFAWLSQQLRVG